MPVGLPEAFGGVKEQFARSLAVGNGRAKPAGKGLVLDLHENRGKLTGKIVMGPGPALSTKREDYWEYFFNPAEFEIGDGVVHGNAISFEQPVFTTLEYSAASTVWDKPMTFKYTGRIEGNRLFLTRELHQKWPYLLNSRNQKFDLILNREGGASGNPTESPVGMPKVLEQRSGKCSEKLGTRARLSSE